MSDRNSVGVFDEFTNQKSNNTIDNQITARVARKVSYEPIKHAIT